MPSGRNDGTCIAVTDANVGRLLTATCNIVATASTAVVLGTPTKPPAPVDAALSSDLPPASSEGLALEGEWTLVNTLVNIGNNTALARLGGGRDDEVRGCGLAGSGPPLSTALRPVALACCSLDRLSTALRLSITLRPLALACLSHSRPPP